MTDVRELLHDAAADRPGGHDFDNSFDFGDVARRVERLRRRTIALAAGAVPTVVAVVVLIAMSLSSSTQAVRTISPADGADSTTTTVAARRTATTASAPAPSAAAGRPTARSGAGAAAGTGAAAPTAGWPADQLSPTPPGFRVVFLRFLQNGNQTTLATFSMNVDGSDQRLLFPSGPTPVSLAADRTMLLVASPETGGYGLSTVNLQTGARHDVAVDPYGNPVDGGFSPDGKRVAFHIHDHQDVTLPSQDTWHIWVADVDGAHAHMLAAMGTNPRWSPDGRHIAYDDQNGWLTLINPDGSGPVTLPVHPYAGSPIAWSPDGSWIAGVDRSQRLFAVHPDGSSLRSLGIGHAAPTSLGWTSDGSRVVYTHSSSIAYAGVCSNQPCEDTYQYGIWSASVDGSRDVPITTSPNDTSPVTPMR